MRPAVGVTPPGDTLDPVREPPSALLSLAPPDLSARGHGPVSAPRSAPPAQTQLLGQRPRQPCPCDAWAQKSPVSLCCPAGLWDLQTSPAGPSWKGETSSTRTSQAQLSSGSPSPTWCRVVGGCLLQEKKSALEVYDGHALPIKEPLGFSARCLRGPVANINSS